jgi:thioredoxin reductase
VASVDGKPFPPGDYDIVVVGSGPGGLQTSYALSRLGVRHAVISADDGPGGMFRHFPVLGHLISKTMLDAPYARDTREYEWYDWNSLVADEPEARGLVTGFMDEEQATAEMPTRAAMAAGLTAFTEQTNLEVRFGCPWESTKVENGGLTLETPEGSYHCRSAVFAIGVTDPWKAPVTGLEATPHYADTKAPTDYAGKRVFIVGKGDAAFELAKGLLPTAKELVLASPDPVRPNTLGRATFPVRYLEPNGHPGVNPLCINASIDHVERVNGGFRVRANPSTWDGDLDFEADEVIAATGFRAPVRDLPSHGLILVANGRIPALTPFWESVSLPGAYFAGNASQGSPGLRKQGLKPASVSVGGHRYNARVLAEHLADKLLGIRRDRPALAPDDVVPYLLAELTRGPELWIQMGYLARVLTFNGGIHNQGVVPLEVFVDATEPDAVAATIELDAQGGIHPNLYVRRDGELEEHELPSHDEHAFESEQYRREVTALLEPLLR